MVLRKIVNTNFSIFHSHNTLWMYWDIEAKGNLNRSKEKKVEWFNNCNITTYSTVPTHKCAPRELPHLHGLEFLGVLLLLIFWNLLSLLTVKKKGFLPICGQLSLISMPFPHKWRINMKWTLTTFYQRKRSLAVSNLPHKTKKSSACVELQKPSCTFACSVVVFVSLLVEVWVALILPH